MPPKKDDAAAAKAAANEKDERKDDAAAKTEEKTKSSVKTKTSVTSATKTKPTTTHSVAKTTSTTATKTAATTGSKIPRKAHISADVIEASKPADDKGEKEKTASSGAKPEVPKLSASSAVATEADSTPFSGYNVSVIPENGVESACSGRSWVEHRRCFYD